MAWRARFYIVAACGILLATSAQGDDRPPYVAFADDDIDLRSGPSPEFYPTERVPRGTRLEVIEADDPQWCGVRPTSDSFSWVDASALRIAPDGQSAQLVENTATRVGSSTAQRIDVEYMPLRQGERVTLVSPQPQRVGGAAGMWIKIVPPAGELRYVRRAELSRTVPAPLLEDLSKSHPAPRDGAPWAEPSRNVPTLESVSVSAIPPESSDGVQKTQYTAPPTSADVRFEDLDDAPPPVDAVPRSEPPTRSAWRAVGASAIPDSAEERGYRLPRTVPAPPSMASRNESMSMDVHRVRMLADQIQEIAALPPERWQLGDVTAQLDSLLRSSQDPDVQSEALDLLATTDRLAEIANRHQQLRTAPRTETTGASTRPRIDFATRGNPPPFARTGLPDLAATWNRVRERVTKSLGPYGNPPGTGPRGKSSAPIVGRYDATGWLTSVISSRDGAPQFALTDADARILQFVEPTAGLNLRPYLKRRVGIVGRRHYADTFRKPVVTASRVIPLDQNSRF